MASTALESDHRRGLVLIASAMIVLSFDALLVRLAGVAAADVLFWRGVFIALSLTLVLRAAQRRWSWQALAAGGLAAVVAALGMGFAQALFVGAVLAAPVANVVMILVTAPVFAAALSGVFLGEWVPARTWIAIGCCIAGVAIVFAGSVQADGWQGNLMALGAAVTVSGVFTVLRQAPAVSRLAVLAAAGVLIALLALPWAAPGAIDGRALAVLALMGLVQMPLAQSLMMVATRFLPSAEVAAFLTVEAILATLLVWLVLGEAPPAHAVSGGAVVITTLVAHSWLALRAERTGAPASSGGAAGANVHASSARGDPGD
jgi:drug/metabolite transporter (DMT)-like permease